jgi:hypothetical protein
MVTYAFVIYLCPECPFKTETPQAFPGPQIRLFVTETGAWSVLFDNKFFMVCGLGLIYLN